MATTTTDIPVIYCDLDLGMPANSRGRDRPIPSPISNLPPRYQQANLHLASAFHRDFPRFPPTSNNTEPPATTSSPAPWEASTRHTIMADSDAHPSASPLESYRMALRYVKTLFLSAEYRRCIEVCRDALKIASRNGDDNDDVPLQRTYINFYLALSYDAMARVMHTDSIAKLPAFNQAEQHFVEALKGLLTPDQITALCTKVPETSEQDDPFTDGFTAAATAQSRYAANRLSRGSSIWLSSPPQLPGAENIPSSPAHTASEMDDVESHENFGEHLTSHGLQRDFSRMSLLDGDVFDKRSSVASFNSITMETPRPKSIRGLMGPIRPGSFSPARHFHLPATPTYGGAGGRGKLSRLPRLSTRARTAPHLGHAQQIAEEPVSPLSHEESDEQHYSESSTISPVSPQTPFHSPPRMHSPDYYSRDNIDEAKMLRLNDHNEAMRIQLETHIELVHESKEQLRRIKAEKTKSTPLPISQAPREVAAPGSLSDKEYLLSSPGRPVSANTALQVPPLQHSHSHWSFAPEDVKAIAKQRRIAEGRERKWQRKRFDPTRYQELCEKALAEV